MKSAAPARLALTLLAVQAVALLVFAAYVVYSQGLSLTGVINGVYLVLSGLFTWVWRGLLAATFATRPVPPEQPVFRLYRFGYPVLLSWRVVTLYLLLLSVSLGGEFTASLLIALLVRAANIWTGLQIFVLTMRVVQKPLEERARAQLRTWLEYGAALGAIMTVITIWPLAGQARLSLPDILGWGLTGALGVAAALAVRAALRQNPKG